MDRSVVFRRFVHTLIALTPLYYLIPEELDPTGVRRWHILVLFFVLIATFETVRLWRGMTFLGLRHHERDSIASFAWAAAGITIGLWLLPMEIATPVLVGLAFVDPLAGELRRMTRSSTGQVAIPVAAYAAICVSALLLLSELSLAAVCLISLSGAVSAVGIERLHVRHLDDDFLMVIVPGAVMSTLLLVI